MANINISRGINEKGQFFFTITIDDKKNYMSDIIKTLSEVDRVNNYNDDIEFSVSWGEQKTVINHETPLYRETSPLQEYKKRILDVWEDRRGKK